MRILAIDYGEKRIGLALSDAMGIIASPLEVLPYDSLEKALSRIRDIVRLKGVKHVVVGLPLDMIGSHGRQAAAAKEFADKLQNLVEASIELWDERLTSAQAERALLEGDVSRADRKRHTDKIAAALLLQSYLDKHRGESIDEEG